MIGLAWKTQRILNLAREMVHLERLARQAEDDHDTLRAKAMWLRREFVQRMRSDLMREESK